MFKTHITIIVVDERCNKEVITISVQTAVDINFITNTNSL